MANTRHGQKGIGVRPYLGFSPKTPAPVVSAPVTRLISIGINGRRVEFEPKNPTIPPIESIVTRLVTFGIGGQRVSFEPKKAAIIGPTSGGTTKKAYGLNKKKKWTEEELKGLEDYGKARLGIVDEPLKITTPSEDELVILDRQVEPDLSVSIEDELILDSQVVLEGIETPDMGLILAIMAAHDF